MCLIGPSPSVIGTKLPSMPAASITRRRTPPTSLAINLGRADRAGRWPSSISPSSMSSMQSKGVTEATPDLIRRGGERQFPQRSRKRPMIRSSRSFPPKRRSFDAFLAEDLSEIPDGQLKTNGIALGQRAASAVLAARATDGSQYEELTVGTGPDNFHASNDPGKWRQDPISQIGVALGVKWGEVKPFVLERGDQFRVPLPPALGSAEYTAAFNEVRLLGGDGLATPTTRSTEQTQIGIFWAYDGTPSLCAPPRLYNQVAMKIAHKMGTDTDALDLARLLALVNVAMADAGIAAWESKYYYQYWRPVTGIREADDKTGPSGLGDGNPGTIGDLNFSPLGAPATNLMGVNFTPPFPSLSLRPCGVWRGTLPDAAELLPNRPHPIHLCLGRIQWRDQGCQ